MNVFSNHFMKISTINKTKIPSFGIRIKSHIESSNINLDGILPITTPTKPPWQLTNPEFIFDLRQHKKSETNEVIIQQHYAEIKSHFPNFYTVYTDGSKDGDRVAAAAVLGKEAATERLPSEASIFTAEATAILLALSIIDESTKTKFIICSDSLSCLLAIKNHRFKNTLIYHIISLIDRLKTFNKEIVFLWVPSHVGIQGNTIVDRVAKEALDDELSNCKIPYTDFKPLIRKYIFNLWNDIWSSLEQNKLHEIKPNLDQSKVIYHNRKDQVVTTRCQIGHSRVTHDYLPKNEPRPICIPCDCAFTIKHILIDCIDFADIRRKYYNVTNMFDLFKTTPTDNILNFLKEINLYHKI